MTNKIDEYIDFIRKNIKKHFVFRNLSEENIDGLI